MPLNAEPIIHFFNERESIRQRRYSGQPWPWTDDSILRTYKFCEVFRKDDFQTRWLVDNWLVPYAEHPNLWFACALFRQINFHETLAEIGFPEGDWEVDSLRALEIIRARAKRGDKVYTGAYVLWGGKGDVEDKPELTLRRIMLGVWRKREGIETYFRETVPEKRSLEWVTKWFTQFEGFSGFLGYESACDQSYTHLLDKAKDRFTWANPGPGANRGLNRLHGRKLDWKIPEKQAVAEMRELLEIANATNSPVGDHVFDRAEQLSGERRLEMRDIESGLCETDKYLRVKGGEGTPRSKFVPPHRR